MADSNSFNSLVQDASKYLPEFYFEEPYDQIPQIFSLPSELFDALRKLVLDFPNLIDVVSCPDQFLSKLAALIGQPINVTLDIGQSVDYWSPNLAYVPGDVVIYQGGYFIDQHVPSPIGNPPPNYPWSPTTAPSTSVTSEVMNRTLLLKAVDLYRIRGTTQSLLRTLRYAGAYDQLLYPTYPRMFKLSRSGSTLSGRARLEGPLYRPGVYFLITDLDQSVWSDQITAAAPAGKLLVPLKVEAHRWSPSTQYIVGSQVLETDYSGYLFTCTQTGTSGTSAPSWQPPGMTTSDGSNLRWINNGLVAALV
jgi:hypothetical protein